MSGIFPLWLTVFNFNIIGSFGVVVISAQSSIFVIGSSRGHTRVSAAENPIDVVKNVGTGEKEG